MLYVVTAELRNSSLLVGPENDFRKLIATAVIPSLDLIAEFERDGRIKAGGVKASSQSLLFVLELNQSTHMAVREILVQLPIFPHYDWQVTPLESFTEWKQFLGT